MGRQRRSIRRSNRIGVILRSMATTTSAERRFGGRINWISGCRFRRWIRCGLAWRLDTGRRCGGRIRNSSSDFSLTRLEDPPPGGPADSQGTTDLYPKGTLIPLGGRWYYEANPGETSAPAVFNQANADRLLYHDAKWQAPFAGNMSAWLRAGDKDLAGRIVLQDVFVPDNVTVSFDSDAMIIHTKGLPNHPTGKFPEEGFGPRAIRIIFRNTCGRIIFR
jgi:hypothetical protein